ncbi:hypothetical protein GOA77_25080 [Sinorhizobium meliloti]|uniref:hypothetical protein n=1 Tax=Rhizobium meliloti TaxID=382 RepID=UPI000FD26203|nr:hypothetical protein [Sinorhizobium meliloti]MDW9905107.1 hypothetical protein [Sinorhizobium meliloti]MDX0022877.1 hypothetical protein [Sinorhizobium meliloti]RVG45822.1 hypothetical protein CN224_33110 [Sinorhizobium meliloti]RVN82059.1 hypothetical protein CN105_25730 [Sinorhizobium meliloti]
MKDCPASEFGCTCNRCAVDRDDDLEALKQFNRASYSLATSLIFLAAVFGVLAAGFWNANRVQELVAHERNV